MINKLKRLSNYSFKYRLLNKLNQWGLLNFVNLTFKSKIHNKVYTIPVIGGIGIGHLVKQELWMENLLQELYPYYQQKIFLDVGVNIGQTLLKMKAIAPNSTYIGFEPNPHCVSYLSHLIAINQINHTSILPVALSDTTGVFQLLFDNDSLSDSSAGIINTYRKGKIRKIDILAIAPNQIPFLQQKALGVIKIDVEGAELEVLRGLKEVIQTSQPIIIIEILPVYTTENEDRFARQNQIEEFVDAISYEIFRINEVTSKLQKVTKLEVHSDLALCNYVLKPKE